MLYKPNFCCNCGEKIERIEWTLLTSRRFCPTCAVEQRRYDHLPRAAVIGGSLALMFGIGSLWAGSASEGVSASQAEPVGIRSVVPASGIPKAAIVSQEPPAAQQIPAEKVGSGPADAEPKQASAPAFYCGALTKKGTPCSRKVKSRGVRCFQHEGRPEAPQS